MCNRNGLGTLLLLIASLLVISAVGQEGRKYKELFPVGKKLSPNAYHLGLGATRMFGPIGGNRDFFWERGDSAYYSENSTRGGFGLYLEGGYSRFYASNSFMDEMSLTGAFIQRTGEQDHTAELHTRRLDGLLDTVFHDGNGYFDHTSVSLAFTATKHLQITDKKYWTIGYGADFNYRMFNTTGYEGRTTFEDHSVPANFMGNIHMRLGYGFYWKSMVLLNPAITIPVASTHGVGPVQYFSNHYVPVLLSIRMIRLNKPKSLECPTIKPNSREKVKKSYYLQELFHPDSRNNVNNGDGDND